MNKYYYLICIECREHIDDGDNLNKITNLGKGLYKGDDTGHTGHKMHIVDDEGNKTPIE